MSRRFALIIGNGKYRDATLTQLVTPDADVDALAEVLRDPEIGNFDKVNTLVNQPTSKVRRAIGRFFARKKRDDLLLLYFSGHGVLDASGKLYLAVKDTERSLLSATAIPATFVTSEMDSSRSRRQVLILDCCHSGAFARGTKGALGGSVGTGTVFKGTGYGRVVMTATDSTQYAWEGNQVMGDAENSVFTHYVIQGIRTGEADINGDGWITLDELYEYVHDQITSITTRQEPRKWSYDQQGVINVARNPHWLVKSGDLPGELRQSLKSSFAWEREGAVRELVRLLFDRDRGMTNSAYKALKWVEANDDNRFVLEVASEGLTVYEAQEIFELDSNWQSREYIQNVFDNQGAVVVDYATGLMWQKTGSNNSLTYKHSEQYVKRLNRGSFAGYSDWRLPTVQELMSLLEPKKQENDLFINPIFDEVQKWCWTADKGPSGSTVLQEMKI